VGNQLDLGVAVHSGIERDVVVAGIDVAKGSSAPAAGSHPRPRPARCRIPLPL